MAKRYQDEIREVLGVLYSEPPPEPPAPPGSPKKKKPTVAETKAAARAHIFAKAAELNLSPMQVATIHHCLENPIAKKELFAQYNKFRVEEAKSSGESTQDLTSERSYVVAAKFLERWEREGVALLVPNGGTIPGFPNNGPAAAASLLAELRQDYSQANPGQSQVPPVAPAGVPGG